MNSFQPSSSAKPTLEGKMQPFRYAIWGGVAMALLSACASDGPEPPKPVTLYVSASPDTNDSRMVYMVIRNVNEKQFIDEPYNLVADKAFPKSEDPTLLGAHPVFPGEKITFNFTTPVKGNAAVYFLFTNPGSHWKTLLETPIQSDYGISLSGPNSVVVGDKPGWIDRWSFN